MAAETPPQAMKAHRVSRHVSFQAVVRPSVAFPVHYSGPSLIQASSHINSSRNSDAASKSFDNEDSEVDRHKGKFSRRISRVISLDYGTRPSLKKNHFWWFQKLPTTSSASSLKLCRHPKKIFIKWRKRTCLIIASLLTVLLVFSMLISFVIKLPSNHEPSSAEFAQRNCFAGLCETTECLRIGLFIQTTLPRMNEQGSLNTCSSSSLQSLVHQIWEGEENWDIRFSSPFELLLDKIASRRLSNSSALKKCRFNSEEAMLKVQNASKVVSDHPSIASIAHILQEATLTFNAFNDVLQAMHVKYAVPMLFDASPEADALEITPLKGLQPWDLFNLESVDSHYVKELRHYICLCLHYAQSVGGRAANSSPANCTQGDHDHVGAVYGILTRLQEVSMVEKVRSLRSKKPKWLNMPPKDLSKITRQTIDFSTYLRNFPGKTTIRVCSTDAIKWISDTLRQTRLSDLQDYIYFCIVNTYGPSSSSVIANAKHRLMSLTFGNIGQSIHLSCLFEVFQSSLREKVIEIMEDEVEGLPKYANEVLLPVIKRNYEKYLGSSTVAANMVSGIVLSPVKQSHRDAALAHTSKAWNGAFQMGNLTDFGKPDRLDQLCGYTDDIGLCTYGTKMLRHNWKANRLEPSVLLLFDKRVNLLNRNPRFNTFAFLGYWISLSIADTTIRFAGDFSSTAVPDSLKLLYKCAFPDVPMDGGRHLSATEYMHGLETMKKTLAVEMLTRSFLEIRGNSTCPLIPGVKLPSGETFFVMLIKTFCSKPNYLELGMTAVCEQALQAMQLSPTLMSLAGCSSKHPLSLDSTRDLSSFPVHAASSECFI